jgi:glutathione S-transferase
VDKLMGFSWYAGSVAALVLHLQALGFLTALRRRQLRGVLNPEDVSLNPGSAVVELEPPALQRVKRAHQNLLENALPFAVIGALFLVTGPSLELTRGLCLTFVVSRLAHSVCYLAQLQPFRTASFIVGSIVQLVMAVQVLRFAVG